MTAEMTGARLDPILLGHNPFFGVDHRSQAAGNAKAQRFDDPRRIVELLSHCHELGVRGMMMSTHPKAQAVCELMAQDAALSTWRLYPLVPYLQRYVRSANTKGLVNMVMETLAGGSGADALSLMLKGGASLLTKDLRRMLTLLIDIELMAFKGQRLGAVFLHDGLTDLALGLGLESVLELFAEHVQRTCGVPGGFVTKNLPLLRARMAQRVGYDLLVMSSFNASGFSVNPSLEACAEAIRSPGMRFVAMNTLAAGSIAPEAAYRFLAGFPSIDSVVVGISRKEQADQTVAMIRRHLRLADGRMAGPATREHGVGSPRDRGATRAVGPVTVDS